MATDVSEMRAYERIVNREQSWAYTEKKTKEQYIRVAIKKLDEEDPEFHLMRPGEQLELVEERAKRIASERGMDENEFVAMDAEGNVLDDEGNIDPDAKKPGAPSRFGDGTTGEVGETRERGRTVTAGQKTFNKG